MIRRNKLAFAAGAALVAVLALGFAISAWQAARAMKAEENEKAARQVAELSSAQEAKQRKLAEENARKAAQNEQSALELFYVADMNLAQKAWQDDDLDRLRQLLEETQESPDRGFEWYYWQRQCHLAEKSFRGHASSVTSAAFFPDGQRIVTGSTDKTAKVWDAASGKGLLTLKGHRGAIESVGVSSDGQRIVTGSGDQTAKVWDAASGKELLTLKGHRDWIWGVSFSPDGRRIATGSGDQTAKVWDAASGKELLTLSGHSGTINDVAFSPNGQRIVTASDDKTAKVWDAASG